MKSMHSGFDAAPSRVAGNSREKAGPLDTSREAIERLALTLRVAVEYDCFRFEGVCPDLHLKVGSPQAHRCTYAITLSGGVCIGQLEVSRHQPFWESELRVLECFVADFCLNLHLMSPPSPHRPDPSVAVRRP